MQSGDDGEEFVEVDAPKAMKTMLAVLVDFALDRYTTQSAFALGPSTQTKAVQKPSGVEFLLIADWASRSGEALFNIDPSIAERRMVLASTSEDYLLARHALHNPTRGFLGRLLHSNAGRNRFLGGCR